MQNEFPKPHKMLRDGAIANASWQFIAQFARRYAREYYFELQQVHPGISIGGILRLALHERTQEGRGELIAMLEFHMGGPDRGGLLVRGMSAGTLDSPQIVASNLVQALHYSNYQELYKSVAKELRLPVWGTKLKPANRFAISMQFISIVQNFLNIYPSEYRPVPGADKTGGSYPQGKADTQHAWAYAYHGEILAKDQDFVGRRDEELNKLITIKLFDKFESADAKFVLSTSDAQLKLSTGGLDYGEQVDVGLLYRKNRLEFLQLATKVALLVTA